MHHKTEKLRKKQKKTTAARQGMVQVHIARRHVMFRRLRSLPTALSSAEYISNQSLAQFTNPGETIRYDTRCYFNVRSKAGTSQLNLPHGTDKWKVENRKTEKVKKRICSEVSVNSPENRCSQSWRRNGRLQWKGFAEKEDFKRGMKEGHGILLLLIIISINVSWLSVST